MAVPVVMQQAGPEQPEVPVVVALGVETLAEQLAQQVKETLVEREILMEPIILLAVAAAEAVLELLRLLPSAVTAAQEVHVLLMV